jgi:phosphoadenosine phosphosulfate reductase
MGFAASPVSDHEPDTMAESGYASGTSSESSIPEIFFSKPHLEFLNRQLQFLEPEGTV